MFRDPPWHDLIWWIVLSLTETSFPWANSTQIWQPYNEKCIPEKYIYIYVCLFVCLFNSCKQPFWHQSCHLGRFYLLVCMYFMHFCHLTSPSKMSKVIVHLFCHNQDLGEHQLVLVLFNAEATDSVLASIIFNSWLFCSLLIKSIGLHPRWMLVLVLIAK